MNDEKKTKKQLIQELKGLRREMSQLKTDINTREKLVVRALPMVFYTAKPEGTFEGTWVSQQIEKLTGFSPRQFIETPGFWSSRLHGNSSEPGEHGGGGEPQAKDIGINVIPMWNESRGGNEIVARKIVKKWSNFPRNRSRAHME